MSVVFAVGLGTVWLHMGRPGVGKAALLGIVFPSVAAMFCIGVLAAIWYWFAKTSHLSPLVEVADGHLTLTTPGLIRVRRRRIPLSRVRFFAAREVKSLGGRLLIDLKMRSGLLRCFRRVFPSPGPGFAGEINAAFVAAMTGADAQPGRAASVP
jgi:hypothetical protein